jgi:transposase
MEQVNTSILCAGIDIAKHHLDVARDGAPDRLRVDNSPEGFEPLIAWLKARGVTRVGLEASGGYERGVRAALEAAGFEVVVHQPLEIRLFAKLRRRRAKNDRLDAALIAQATAQIETCRQPRDPRLDGLAEWLTAYERCADELAALKTFLEGLTDPELRAQWQAEIVRKTKQKQALLVALRARIKPHADLEGRYQLLRSLPGVGEVVAVSLLIRMPELGRLKRGQAAALIGVAPYDRESGQWRGLRTTSGGRLRPRCMLYIAALAAKRFCAQFCVFARALTARGKPPKVVTVAVMRKLIEAANLVLARGTPWLPKIAN